jgi:hypothetical protein
MNERATRMLFAAAALSAFAAVLASTANAYAPEGAGVPAEIYAASASPVASEQQTPQTSGTFFVDPEIYAASTSPVASEQQTPQTSGTFFVDPEIYAASTSPVASQQQSVREKLGETGAWVVPYLSQGIGVDKSLFAGLPTRTVTGQKRVARAFPYVSYLGHRSPRKSAALPHGAQVGIP